MHARHTSPQEFRMFFSSATLSFDRNSLLRSVTCFSRKQNQEVNLHRQKQTCGRNQTRCFRRTVCELTNLTVSLLQPLADFIYGQVETHGPCNFPCYLCGRIAGGSQVITLKVKKGQQNQIKTNPSGNALSQIRKWIQCSPGSVNVPHCTSTLNSQNYLSVSRHITIHPYMLMSN